MNRFVARRGRTVTMGLHGKQIAFHFDSAHKAAQFRSAVEVCVSIEEAKRAYKTAIKKGGF